MEKFCIWALTQPERKPDGADKKPICRVLGRGVCSTRFATSNADAQSTKITWCPNKSWTTPQNIVGALCWKNLENVRKGKIRRYAEQSQWSFYQLLQFILYKAALRGVMVIEADPAYTSQECSRCHRLTKPNGKKFVCGKCGHNDHRDANAPFSLAERVMPIGGVVGDSVRSDSGLLIAPFLGTEVQQCN